MPKAPSIPPARTDVRLLDIRRGDFPPSTQAQGMSSQASTWLLEQIEANQMTTLEALQVVGHMLQTVTRLAEWNMEPQRRKQGKK